MSSLLPSPALATAVVSLLWLSSCGDGEKAPTHPDASQPGAQQPGAQQPAAGAATAAAAAAGEADEGPWHRTPSGLQYRVLQEGHGDEHPAVDDLVLSRFHFRLPNGEPLRHLASPGNTKMRVGTWIDAWNEGVQLMTPGAHYRFRAPAKLARAQGAGIAGVPPNSPLLFDVELISIERMPHFERLDPKTALQLDDEKHAHYVWVEKGSGEPPSREDRIVMHVTRWDGQGKMLESTRWVDEPLDVMLKDLDSPLLRQAAVLMPVGSVMRLQGPNEIALPPQLRKPPASRGVSQWLLQMVKVLPPLPPPDFVRPDPKDLQTTGSGLQYQILEAGRGDPPSLDDRVRLHYAAWLEDGTLFDDSYSKAKPADLNVGTLIPGWREALQLMRPGARFRVVVPPKLAYGEKGVEGKVPPNSTLIFDMHLLEVLPPLADPFAELRKRLAAPPSFALPSGKVETTGSGVRYQVVRPGVRVVGGKPPRARYVAWLADGTQVESTWDSPGVPPTQLPEGAQEAAHQIGVGGEVRAVVPPDLAYGAEGKPPLIGASATLIYAIDLVAAADDGAPPPKGKPGAHRPGAKAPRKAPRKTPPPSQPPPGQQKPPAEQSEQRPPK